eukprot:TRINITY_DN39148_c0_g1_i1.p1 TRINITY_DN39148_c0_g1~~TRINITY_DN39148_c0_g1_i1.p1  ORF type:complete len:105 (-),score=19.07 TRINITY_DN39148_c0_g1_i1:33-347(-)
MCIRDRPTMVQSMTTWRCVFCSNILARTLIASDRGGIDFHPQGSQYVSSRMTVLTDGWLTICVWTNRSSISSDTVSYTHLRAHETPEHLVCRLLLEKKNTQKLD